MRRGLALALFLSLFLVACSGDDDTGPATTTMLPAAASGFVVSGGDVAEGEPIDPLHTCDGNNISPALVWEGVPDGTAELALIVNDPDAPGGAFTHWVVYAIPADFDGPLGRGIPPGPALSGGLSLRQGQTDGSEVPGWFGPCPPEGETHDYVFTLYALDEETGLEGGASADDLRAAIEGHVLLEASLTAPYTRP